MTESSTPSPIHAPRWFLPVVGGAIIALILASNLGNAVWSCAVVSDPGRASSICGLPGVSWFADNPLGLVMLNSSNKYLLATSILTDLVPYVLIALVRLSIPDPLFYMLGYIYRGRALHWARQAFPPMNPIFDQFESQGGATQRVLDIAVFVAPNNPVCLLAGVAAMPLKRFIVLNVAGTLSRIALMRTIGLVFSDQIENVLDVVARYQRWFTLGSVALVAIVLVYQVVGRRGMVRAVETLEDELGED